MKLVYATNIWSHHQAPIARALERLVGEDFRFAVFEELPPERRSLGWGDREDAAWVIGPPRDRISREQLVATCIAADVLVFGDCPAEVLVARVAARKLTLVASERMLKNPLHRLRLLNPRYAIGHATFRRRVNHPHVHALAIGHHAGGDLRTIGAFGDRIWRWGYFADVSPSAPAPRPPGPIRILWVGRMLDWKRVDTLLVALARARASGAVRECLIVGDGPERERLKALATTLKLDPGPVRFEAAMPFPRIRELMRHSDVYVLASDRKEGWGVVANEAMSEGCVLVANEAAGAAGELVDPGVTGLLFRDGDAAELAGRLEDLASDPARAGRLRSAAWECVASVWSPRVAAERLVDLCDGLLRSRPPHYEGGPCSRA